MSAIIQSRFGEDAYPIGRFILDRAKALGLSRTDMVRRSGYRDLNSGQRALTDFLMTGVVPSFVEKKLAGVLEVEQEFLDRCCSRRRGNSMMRCGPAYWREKAHIAPRFGRIYRYKRSDVFRRRFLSRRC
jgi:hypothetical protein